MHKVAQNLLRENCTSRVKLCTLQRYLKQRPNVTVNTRNSSDIGSRTQVGQECANSITVISDTASPCPAEGSNIVEFQLWGSVRDRTQGRPEGTYLMEKIVIVNRVWLQGTSVASWRKALQDKKVENITKKLTSPNSWSCCSTDPSLIVCQSKNCILWEHTTSTTAQSNQQVQQH